MDKDIILAKIESLERCIDRVIAKTPTGCPDLLDDVDRQDIIVLNLERAVQLCVDIAAHIVADLKQPAPMSMSESFDRLRDEKIITEATAYRMKAAVGFRNIAVHAYREIDWDVVFVISTEHLDDFRVFAGQIFSWMQAR
jgi:uncharacterized protein YutE (UPF0331/DUF86 family)